MTSPSLEEVCKFLFFSSKSTRQIADHLKLPIDKTLRIMKKIEREGYVEGEYTFHHPYNQGYSWSLNKSKCREEKEPPK